MSDYSERLESRVRDAFEVAQEARSRGEDPSDKVEMEIAEDIADRCEKLLGIDGLSSAIHELEEKGLDREEIAFELSEKMANKEVGNFEDDKEIVDAAVRASVALLTEGIVAAPIDGIGEVQIGYNDDNSRFVRIPYFGPIRSAGGTGQALSVLIADYVRRELGIERYRPYDEEIERYVEEIRTYDDVSGLQYSPKDKEVRHIVKNCPIMLDGAHQMDAEVDGYRDLERLGGPQVREGLCLVLAEGIAQKAPKLKKYTDSLEIEGWDWIDELISGGESDEDEEDEEDEEEISGKFDDKVRAREDWQSVIKPKEKYLDDIIAGRPVFAGASRPGGFRLRYGRARNTGMASVGVNPATMVIMDGFIANGTQLKTERPGKAAGMSAVDSVEGPTVKLKSGEVRRIDDHDEAERVVNGVEEILDLGEIAVPYGEFLENNHPLAPSPYVHEWWIKEYKEASGIENPDITPSDITAEKAFNLAEEHDIPLHPNYTYMWHDLDKNEYEALSKAVEHGEVTDGKLALTPEINPVLEKLLVQHIQENEITILPEGHSSVIQRCCSTESEGEEVLDMVETASGVEVRERALVRIGARLGRPEKSKRREMRPKVHALFPVGDAGGSQRDVEKAANYTEGDENQKMDGSGEKESVGVITDTLSNRRCPDCRTDTWRTRCPECNSRTDLYPICTECGTKGEDGESCKNCGESVRASTWQELDISSELDRAVNNLGVNLDKIEQIKGVEGLTSEKKIVEPLEKGILRAKHDVSVFRDGTSRYDMSDLPLTAFKPEEANASVEQLRELGYNEDIYGNPLEEDDQVIELMPQDIILSKDCGDRMIDIANFIDELLEEYYDLDPFYDVDERSDLIGELGVGLAPHTSAGVLCRIVGFTDSLVNFASPFYHAAKRRNCDGDEDSVMLLMDGFLNFSQKYLPDQRGKRTMDAPLVITSYLDPGEVDDEAYNVETVSEYPIDFYERTMDTVGPKEVDIDIAESLIDTGGVGFMHSFETSSISKGVNGCSYKNIDGMDQKTAKQLELARKIRAVDELTVVEGIVKSHYLPDIMGNLKAFTQQDVRCAKCNTKYPRPPLAGECEECGNTSLTLTVHEGSVSKYIDIASRLVTDYDVDDYTAERVKQLEDRIDSIFVNDSSKQSGLGEFM